MNAAATSRVRGWCPGALRPMQSGDGLIVRVRPRAGALALPAVRAVCDAAERYGSGLIDLTRRANLQIRGVREATLQPLLDRLAEHDLLDPTPEAEAVRNVIVSPLSGADATALLDMRPIAREIEAAVAADDRLWALPSKTGFVLDGGGTMPLDAIRADVRLTAVEHSGDVAVRIEATGSTTREVSTGIAAAAAIDAAIALRGVPHSAKPRDVTRQPAPARRLGVLPRAGERWPVGIAAPFGRIDARDLAKIAECAWLAGCGDMRLSPWRAFYLVAESEGKAQSLLARARLLALIVDDSDPLLCVDACPGAPACSSAALATREVARGVATLIRRHRSIGSAHISGCPKGCARSSAADLVLVAERDGYAVIRHGRADDSPTAVIAPDRLDALAPLLEAELGAHV